MAEARSDERIRVCRRTGLQLVRPPGLSVYRAGKAARKPWSAQLRDESPNRARWGRWDTTNGRTTYAAESLEAAFAEVIPYIREKLPATTLRDLFPDDDLRSEEGRQSLSAAVRGQMPCPDLRDRITRGWRDERRIFEISLPTDQWLIDIDASATLSALNATLVAERAEAINAGAPDDTVEVQRLTLADLTGEDRYLTTSIAGYIRNLTLDDGSRALGVRYQSKHGSDLVSFAIWLRATDDGNPSGERARVEAEFLICASNPALNEAARKQGMTVIQ